jgi:hypothetical protein
MVKVSIDASTLALTLSLHSGKILHLLVDRTYDGDPWTLSLPTAETISFHRTDAAEAVDGPHNHSCSAQLRSDHSGGGRAWSSSSRLPSLREGARPTRSPSHSPDRMPRSFE